MPYGIDKDIGGDNESNTQFMERCVKRVMSRNNSKTNSPYTKEAAIRICKVALQKSKSSQDRNRRLDIELGLLEGVGIDY